MKPFAKAIERAARITGGWKEVEPDYKRNLKAATDLFHGVFKRLAGEMTVNDNESSTGTTQQTLFECSTINVKL